MGSSSITFGPRIRLHCNFLCAAGKPTNVYSVQTQSIRTDKAGSAGTHGTVRVRDTDIIGELAGGLAPPVAYTVINSSHYFGYYLTPSPL